MDTSRASVLYAQFGGATDTTPNGSNTARIYPKLNPGQYSNEREIVTTQGTVREFAIGNS